MSERYEVRVKRGYPTDVCDTKYDAMLSPRVIADRLNAAARWEAFCKGYHGLKYDAHTVELTDAVEAGEAARARLVELEALNKKMQRHGDILLDVIRRHLSPIVVDLIAREARREVHKRASMTMASV